MAPVVSIMDWHALPGRFGSGIAQFQRIAAVIRRHNPTASAWLTLFGGEHSYTMSVTATSASLAAAFTENDTAMADPETHAIIAEAAANPSLTGLPRLTLLRPRPEFHLESWAPTGQLRTTVLAALAPHPDVLAALPTIDAAAPRHGLVANAMLAQIGGPVPPHVVGTITGPSDSFGDRFEAFSADPEVAAVLQATMAHRFGSYLTRELAV